MTMRQRATERMVLSALFAALTAVCAQVVIPVGVVPVSLSLLPVLLCGALLRPWDTVIAMGTYLLMGLFGLPVFTGLQGGPGKLLGPTGGYILGYIPCAVLIALISQKNRSLPRTIIGMVIGVLTCYLFGTLWYTVGTCQNLWTALSVCVFPFILFDAGKIVLATLLSHRLVKAGFGI